MSEKDELRKRLESQEVDFDIDEYIENLEFIKEVNENKYSLLELDDFFHSY